MAEMISDQLAEQVRNATKAGYDEHVQRCAVYDRAYNVYRASGPYPRGMEPWQTKLRIKYAMYNLDTALVNVIGGAPRAKVTPRGPESMEKAKMMQSVLDYYADKARVPDIQAVVAQQALIYGATVAKTSWLYKESEKMQRRFVKSPFDESSIELPPAPVQKVAYDGPYVEPWDLYDAWWDPFGRSVDTASYVVLRSFMSKAELEQNAHLYKNLDKLFQSGDAADRSRTSQDVRTQAERPMDGRFEIWEVWTDSRLIVVGNKCVVIRDEPNPHWHQQKPIIIATARPDLFKMHGIPETELIEHLQEALWTLQGMRFDNLKMTVMRGLTYREGGVPDPNILIMRPRFRWPVSDHDDIAFQAPPPLPPEAYTEERSLTDMMERVTGINPYVSGNVPGSVSHTTATSVQLLQSAATRLLQFKGTQLNNLCWTRVFNQWGDDIQQFMTDPVWAKITHGNKSVHIHANPADVQGDFDIRIVGADEQTSRDAERQQALQLLQTFAPFAQLINYKVLVERVAEAYDMNPDELANPPQQAAPPASPQPENRGNPLAAMGGGGQPLPPEIQAAIQQGGMG